MERFPDFQSLADAEEEEVLNLWAGLGYYSRARRLQQTVREVLARYDGALPEDAEELEKLPGIGPYTAGAIASIAFGAAVPAVDGNVRRVLSRVADVGDPSLDTLRRWAGELVDPSNPGEFNQALMELGSLVCLPRNPACAECPVSTLCAARKTGTQLFRPTPPRRRRPPQFHEAVAVLIRHEGDEARALLRRRPVTGLLGGMWEFPSVEIPPPEDDSDGRMVAGAEAARNLALQLLDSLEAQADVTLLGDIGLLPPIDHIFSHRKVRYAPFLLHVNGGTGLPRADLRWVTRKDAKKLPLPAAQRTLASRVWSL
jgi:A/G-specific adenine glycosylase